MTCATGRELGGDRQRGFWLRYFLGGALLGLTASAAAAQCVSPTMPVSRVRGTIFDRTGQPIPNVEVDLKQDEKIVARSTTGNNGQFTIPASPGTYWLDAKAGGFAPGYARLDVGKDLVRALRPTNLWMILDVGVLEEDQCTFVTTSHRQFQRAITIHDSRTMDHE